MDELNINEINREDYLPTGKELWKVGANIASYFKNSAFLTALYGEGRAADIMHRYLSGQTLGKIGNEYGLTRERIRQLCAKYLRQLFNQISYYTKDVIEYEPDKRAKVEAATELKIDRRRPWTEEDLNKVVEMKHSGRSFRTIANEMVRFAIDVRDHYYARLEEIRSGKAPVVVIPAEQNEESAPQQCQPRDPSLPWNDEDIVMLRSLRSQGMYIRDIAKQMQRNPRDVSAKLEELGIKTHYRNPETLTDEEKITIVSKFQEEMSIADIAEEYTIKQMDLAAILSERGLLPERLSNEGKPWSSSEIEELTRYVERDYPIGEIGYRLGRNHREVTSQIYELIKSSLD